MKRIVVDTNVLVSGLISPHGPPGRIVDWLRTGVLELAVDDRILHEYAGVLRRPYFARYFSATEGSELIRYLELNSLHVVCSRHGRNLPDPKDAPFFETAYAAGVSLVTGNTKHFPPQPDMVVAVQTPAQFVARNEGP